MELNSGRTIIFSSKSSTNKHSRRSRSRDSDSDSEEIKNEERDPFGIEDFDDDPEENEELSNSMLLKHGFKKRNTDAILSCSSCFTTLCNQCQQHEIYHTQFRALLVTPEVRVSKESIKWIKNDITENAEEFWTVFCRICNVEVGLYEVNTEIYHFHDVLPS